MRKITLFMNVSLDGYVEAPGHDLSWAHQEPEAFSLGGSGEVDTILLGHRTYEMMCEFWPTPQAFELLPELAAFMNETPKLVASHQPFEPGWSNTRVISDDVPAAIAELKRQQGKDMIILGSNTLCASLLQAGLLDELQIQVNPVVLGAGTSLFKGLPERASLQLTSSRALKSGAMLLTYGV